MIESEQLMAESGLRTLLRAYDFHGGEMLETLVAALISFASQTENYLELFTQHLMFQAKSQVHFIQVINDVAGMLINAQRGKKVFIDSGVLGILVRQAIEFADNSSPTGQNPELRQASLAFLASVWIMKPDEIQGKQKNASVVSSVADQILNVIKRGCRDPSRSVVFMAISLAFNLLEHFAKDRNMFAPIIFKALVFIMIDNGYMQLDLRQEMLKNFATLFKRNQTMPIQILCQPLLKQVLLYQQKLEAVDDENIGIQLNAIDFEFLRAVATHERCQLPLANQVLECVLEIAARNILFTRVCLHIAMLLI